MDPIKKLDFITAEGTNGNVENDLDITVIFKPAIIMIIDTAIVNPGPLTATSNAAVLDVGNERNGVMQPKLPT